MPLYELHICEITVVSGKMQYFMTESYVAAFCQAQVQETICSFTTGTTKYIPTAGDILV